MDEPISWPSGWYSVSLCLFSYSDHSKRRLTVLTMQAFLDIIHDGKVFSYTCYKRGTGEQRTFVGRVDVAKHVKGVGLNFIA